MRVSVVIPVHNAPKHVQRCIESLGPTAPNADVVLVDDASDRETREYLEAVAIETGFPLLRNEKQQLFTRTANRGLRYAYRTWHSDAFVLLNSDCELKKGWLTYLLKPMVHDERVGITGYRDGHDEKEWKKREYTEVHFPGYVTGHCLLLRRQMLEEVGLLCETDTTGRDDPALAAFHGQAHIGSERILGWKSMTAGWKNLYCNAPLVEHGPGASWKRDLSWLSRFTLEPLWNSCDTLDEPVWYNG